MRPPVGAARRDAGELFTVQAAGEQVALELRGQRTELDSDVEERVRGWAGELVAQVLTARDDPAVLELPQLVAQGAEDGVRLAALRRVVDEQQRGRRLAEPPD